MKSISSSTLKKYISLVFVLLMFLIYVLLFFVPYDFLKILVCFYFSFFGLFLRGYVYYGIFKKDERLLMPEDIEKCRYDYFMYSVTAMALVCFVFLTFYETFNKLKPDLFILISAILFICFGFAINESANKFIFKRNE